MGELRESGSGFIFNHSWYHIVTFSLRYSIFHPLSSCYCNSKQLSLQDLTDVFEEIREMEDASLKILEEQLIQSKEILDKMEVSFCLRILLFPHVVSVS